MLQIDQVALAAAEEVVWPQGLLQLGQGALCLQVFVRQVVDEAVVHHLNIEDPGYIQLAHPSLEDHGDIFTGAALHALQGPLHSLGEGKVAYRLENIVQRVHGIALHHILGGIGDENDDHFLVHLPDGFGGLHTVHIGHENIHQDNVVIGFVVIHDLGPVGKHGNVDLFPGFPGKAL